jgi:hypothetical protein
MGEREGMRGVVKAAYVLGLVCCVFGGTAAQGLALSKDRAYEMVSPVYKGGYGINNVVAVAPDGEHVAFVSLGACAGDPANNVLANYYVARREGGGGWSTAPLTPPAGIAAFSVVDDFSPTLDSTLSGVRLGPNKGRAEADDIEQEFLFHQTDAPDVAPNFEVAGMVLKDLDETPFFILYEGASSDFSHVVFEGNSLKSEQLLPEAGKTESHLYDLVTGRVSGERSLQLVGLNNKDKVVNPSCRAALGLGHGGNAALGLGDGSDQFNAISKDGSEVFFTTGVDSSCADPQLFVRLGGMRTLEVSKSLLPACHEVPCLGATEREPSAFRGASEDGSKVFFVSVQPLVPGNADVSENLYMARIGCPESEPECEAAGREVTGLVEVSHDPNGGEPAEVRNVVSIAPDGSHVYFVARGNLLTSAEQGMLAGEGRAIPKVGADNLYVYNSITGTTEFVVDLCSGSELSGATQDLRCPPGLAGGELAEKNDTPLWTSTQREAQLNVCDRPCLCECSGDRETGRFLVFSSYGKLTGDDTDAGKDIYRYDSVTGTLERVSIGENGYDADGNADGFDATLAISKASSSKLSFEQRGMNSRAVSEDGLQIVFSTAETLSSGATKGFTSAYEWNEDNVSLVSGSGASGSVENVLISSSGNDVFFTTTQGLVPQDTDGQEDVYDARLNGGFPSAPAEVQACSGDACQGPLSSPAPLLVPGSLPQASGENFLPVKRATSKKAKLKKKVKRPKKHAKKRHVAKHTSIRGRRISGGGR